MVLNAIFNNISLYIVAFSVIGGGNWSTLRTPQTCRKSLTKKKSQNMSQIVTRPYTIYAKSYFKFSSSSRICTASLEQDFNFSFLKKTPKISIFNSVLSNIISN
jgi:hypothetical protein